jgi:hypothetical protein
MEKSKINVLISMTLQLSGIIIVALCNWKIAIGIFLFVAGSNIQIGTTLRNEFRSAIRLLLKNGE